MANTPLSAGDDSGPAPVLDLLGRTTNQFGDPAQGPAASFYGTEPYGTDSGELRALREDLLSADQRGYEQLARFTQAIDELKAAIPDLIEEAVGVRFLEIENAFQRNIKDAHSRSIDAFTQSLQGKIGQRIAALENNLAAQADVMGQLREHYLNTDRSVQRLMAGLDRLTAELTRQSPPGPPPAVEEEDIERKPEVLTNTGEIDDKPLPAQMGERRQRIRRSRKPSRLSRLLIPAGIVAVLIPLAVIGWQLFLAGAFAGSSQKPVATQSKASAQTAAHIAASMKEAGGFSAAKDYARAESVYREVVRLDPANRAAIRELASVLFRQQKYEEAAAALKTLPPE